MKKAKRTRRAKTAKRARATKKPARKPKRKAVKRKVVKRKAVKRKALKKPAAKRKAPARATRRRKPAKRVTRPRAATRPAAPRAAAAPAVAAAAGPSHMAQLVEAALRLHGSDPAPEVVEAIATVGAGYRKGPASDSPLGLPFDTDAAVAPELVQRYITGDRATLLDLHVHRQTVRAVIDMNLEQLGLNDVGEVARAALTSLSLGSWNPATDEVAKRNAIGGFIVRWYRDGLA